MYSKRFFAEKAGQVVFEGHPLRVSIISWFWSAEMFSTEKMGASSCWQGAASLCFVLAETPPSSTGPSSISFLKAGHPL